MTIPERIGWAAGQLDVRPSDHILEIGCGPGHALTLLCASLEKGSVTAIDRSALQVRRARERAGCARVELCSLTDAPAVLEGRQFDKILAVNVNAFWTAPAPSLESARQMLRPRGKLHLVYEPPSPGQMRKIVAVLTQALPKNALAMEDVRETTFRASLGVCVVAVSRISDRRSSA